MEQQHLTDTNIVAFALIFILLGAYVVYNLKCATQSDIDRQARPTSSNLFSCFDGKYRIKIVESSELLLNVLKYDTYEAGCMN